jgi:hypothetical protein
MLIDALAVNDAALAVEPGRSAMELMVQITQCVHRRAGSGPPGRHGVGHR